jgi:thiamine-phosphate pyrophosphorylase
MIAFGIAGELAAERSAGPGTFRPNSSTRWRRWTKPRSWRVPGRDARDSSRHDRRPKADPRASATPRTASRPDVYLVTEESLSAGRRSEEIVEAALEAGVRVVQVREKDGSARRALEIARAVRRLTRSLRRSAHRQRPDRHRPSRPRRTASTWARATCRSADARRLLGGAALIGLSITDAGAARRARHRPCRLSGRRRRLPDRLQADATLTGLALLAARAATAGRPPAPIVAIGGITAENAGRAVLAGADLVAVISAITSAPDPGRAAAAILEAVREAAPTGRSATASPRRCGPMSGSGEFELIASLASRLDPAADGLGIGDDAAAWAPTPGALVVATTDMLVEGVHFRLDWTIAARSRLEISGGQPLRSGGHGRDTRPGPDLGSAAAGPGRLSSRRCTRALASWPG